MYQPEMPSVSWLERSHFALALGQVRARLVPGHRLRAACGLVPVPRGRAVSSLEALRMFKLCGTTSCLYSLMRSFILKLWISQNRGPARAGGAPVLPSLSFPTAVPSSAVVPAPAEQGASEVATPLPRSGVAAGPRPLSGKPRAPSKLLCSDQISYENTAKWNFPRSSPDSSLTDRPLRTPWRVEPETGAWTGSRNRESFLWL